MPVAESATGANMSRNETMWQIAAYLATADASETHGRSLDMCIQVGSGSGERFAPRLSLANGMPALAHSVASGDVDCAFVNPSALLTQAYRGAGIFTQPLPLRAIAVYPSWDRAVCLVRPRVGLRSLGELIERRLPVQISIRGDATHATRVLLDQWLAYYGVALSDLEAWGCSFQLNVPPHDARRFAALERGEVDLVFDEGIKHWLAEALDFGMQPLPFDEGALRHLEAIGWRRAALRARDRIPNLREDYLCVDFSGWPLYTRASLPDAAAYQVCEAIAARVDAIPWEEGAFTGIDQLGRETESTPLDVPLHPGARQWYRDQGFSAKEGAR